MGRIIEWVKPLQAFLPEVEGTRGGKSRVAMNDKIFWTVCGLLVYLVCSNLPLFGIGLSRNSDSFYILRMIMASSKGTLMELGISPIITSGMILQLLAGTRIIEVDQSIKEDRELFQSAQKLLGIILTVGEAVAYVLSGMYGDIRELGVFICMALIVQLVFGGLIVLMLDDMLSKYGLGSGLNLFIVTNICENIVWKCLSPTMFNAGKGTEFEGAIINLFHSVFTKRNPIAGITDALFRENLPNVTNIVATVLVFLVVIYVQGFKYSIPLTVTNGPAQAVKPYEIKLFYTSNMPIILLSTLISQVYFFSQVLFRRYNTNVLIRLLGIWSDESQGGGSRPIGGLAYYISPPSSFADVMFDPFHGVFYMVFMLSACALFARLWVEVSGAGPHDVARQLADNQLTIRGFEREPTRRLAKIIPTAAAFGGMCIAALSIAADLLNAFGNGTGILMAVTIIYDLYEKFQKDVTEEVKRDPDSWWAQFVQKKFKTV